MILLRATPKFIDLPYISLKDINKKPKIVISAGGISFYKKCCRLFPKSEIIKLFDIDKYSLELNDNLKIDDDIIERSLRIDRQLNREKFFSTIYHDTKLIKETKDIVKKKSFISAYYSFWEKILRSNSIKLVILSTISSVDTLTLIYAASHLKIKFIFLQHSRIKDRFLFQDKLMKNKTDFLLNVSNVRENDIQFSKKYYEKFINSDNFFSSGVKFKEPHKNLYEKLNNINYFKEFFHHILKGDNRLNFRKPNFIQFYNYNYKIKKNILAIDKILNKFKSINDIDFNNTIYLPLQVNPENSVSFYSNSYDTAEQLILNIIKIIPKKYKLLIKENSSMIPYRTSSFYNWLLSLKNIEILKFDTPNIDLIRRSDYTISVNGSSSLEAAFLGKRGILLSPTIFSEIGEFKWVLDKNLEFSDQGVSYNYKDSINTLSILHANSFSLKSSYLWGNSEDWYSNYKETYEFTLSLDKIINAYC